MKTRTRSIPIARPLITDDEKRRVLAVLDSGRLVAGNQVRAFEEAFAAYLGLPFAVATSSGTTALQVALEALGIGRGDAVITTPFTFVATANAILYTGARPIFVDVDEKTANLDPNQVEDALRREGARAVLPVHLYGLPAEVSLLAEIALRRDALLVEDCAQAHGAMLHGRKVGTFGQAAVFSFYPTKNMTTGEGGMVVTPREEVARRAALLVNVGQDGADPYRYEQIGYNYRMTEIAAAIGLGQLQRLDEQNALRRRHAQRLSAGLADLDWLTLPGEPPGSHHVYNQYTVRVAADRDGLARHLAARGIATRVYYPQLIPHSPAYRRLGYGGTFPVAEKLTRQVLSLPVHPALAEDDVDWIIESVRAFPGPGRV
ncbi:MAG: DegT/DnrJ/EryC1/StrS family aminotransferase [Armatimonadota bacterium]|nr:DegT/DnrJ/EryC1/StrS family aminotransferase [Armatimonadota bacterium]MDR7450307.1 DegT/DnrJ/EryC1/StrS family aminotransferase [Armatimonadota bacterium]MDR7467110.1 DegT/DnrJ/EryC1/StrS family aminotransferase [Armatimonadota bacterium]MDR7493348.1 DegT/DnrJ/EryC1/StrS family aminotransferase [Armatimonadota bacterium]MDR7499356.1 DegT/DnrJ/EryC1/StrS family aminotransferase [Armatimonadota bacterium]